MKSKLTTLVAALVAASGIATAEPQGVTDDKILIGSANDLSGPLAIWGVPSANGMRMRFEEANAAGGIHGREIELLVEDTGYQVPQAVRLTNKLVKKDRIFAMMMTMGTPQNLATMAILDKAGIPNLFPLSAAEAMVEPLHPLHFGYFVSNRDQASGALRYFAANMDVKNVCMQTVASDYGQSVVNGAEAAVEELNLNITFHGTHKTTETEFAGAATAIKNADCDMLLLGTTIKDTITLYATLRKLGFDKPVVGNMTPYMPLVAEAGNGATEGLYLVSPFLIADFNDGDAWRKDFFDRYNAKFGAAPAAQAQIGYNAADIVVKALEAAGPDLTVARLTAALEGISGYQDPFGGPSLSFAADKHHGSDSLVLVQAKDKKWTHVASDLSY